MPSQAVLLHINFILARVLADVQPVGNFLVGNCGTNFPDVKDLLQQMSARIDQVIETIDASSIDMTDQYYAFFDGVEQRIIRGILASMSDGNDVPTNNPTPGYLQRPTLVCFDPRAPRHKIWATKCQTGVAAIWIADTQLTILCPGFMNLKLEPTKQDCSTAIDRGTYLSGPALMTTKVTVLIQALTHMYIPGKVLSPEVHGLNPCMSLSEFQSPLNPQNYAFFIGSEFFPSSFRPFPLPIPSFI